MKALPPILSLLNIDNISAAKNEDHILVRICAKPVTVSIVGALALFSSLLNYLYHNQYPLFTYEVFLSIIILFIFPLIMGIIYRISSKKFRFFWIFLLLAIFLEININIFLLPAIGLILVLLLRNKTIPILGLISIIICVSTLTKYLLHDGEIAFQPEKRIYDSSSDQKKNSNLPVIIHLILDGHMGVEGLREDNSYMQEKLMEFYLENNFHIFGGAYTKYPKTLLSIPEILNLGKIDPKMENSIIKHDADTWTGGRVILLRNDYFSKLNKLNFNINVSEIRYLKYCSFEFIKSCKTFPTSSIGIIRETDIIPSNKAYLLILNFFTLSDITYNIGFLYDLSISYLASIQGSFFSIFNNLPELGIYYRHFNSSIIATHMLDDLSNSIVNAAPGDFYFFHGVLPHGPFVLDENCHSSTEINWRFNSSKRLYQILTEKISENYTDIYKHYNKHVQCTFKKIKNLIDVLESLALPNGFIMIVHGDHGSRIPDITHISSDEINDQIIRDNYSTLFAVRAPDITPGYDPRPVAVSTLLRQLAASEFRIVTGQENPSLPPVIFLPDEHGDFSQKYPYPYQKSQNQPQNQPQN